MAASPGVAGPLSRLAVSPGARSPSISPACLAEFGALADALPDAVVLVQDEVVAANNEAALRLFAPGARGMLAGRPFLALVHAEDREDAAAQAAGVLAGNEADRRFMPRRMLRLDASAFEAAVGIAPIALGGRPALLNIVRDMQEAHALQRELERSRQDLAALSGRLIELQETERRSIARELHDEIGQSLSAIRVQFAKLQRRVHDADVLNLIRSAAAMTESTLGRVRGLSLLLHPPQLETLGLEAALQWHVQERQKVHGVPIALHTQGLNRPIRPEVAIAGYRLVQEAVGNALKHGEPTHIRVELLGTHHALLIDVSDDGRGFDPVRLHEFDAAPTLGLLGMHERARLLGGELSVSSQPGAGTRIAAVLPWR